MTQRQAKAIENVLENHGNVSQAMLAAGYDPSTAKNPKELTQSKAFKELIGDLLPDYDLLMRHKESLNAMKWNEFSGEVVPDHSVRLKGVELGYKVKGYLRPDGEQAIDNSRTYIYEFHGATDPFKRQFDALHGSDPNASGQVPSTELAPQSSKDNPSDLPTSSVGG